jgi:broad specificity phosphatase PhoE
MLTSEGKRQILKEVAPALEPIVASSPTWIWSSINSCSYQTAEILTSALGLRQRSLIPEYSFMDPRGLGALDGLPMSEVMPVLQEGDASSPLWRPPRGVLHAPQRRQLECYVCRGLGIS